VKNGWVRDAVLELDGWRLLSFGEVSFLFLSSLFSSSPSLNYKAFLLLVESNCWSRPGCLMAIKARIEV